MAKLENDASRSAAAELIDLLNGIARRSLAHAKNLPQQVEYSTYWEGILFSVMGESFLSPLNEVVEILNYPAAITKVPGTKSWVRGIANVRGNLLPIVDLQAFLEGGITIPGRRSRVLVVQHREVFTGLLVGDMVGIRHFDEAQLTECQTLQGSVAKYVSGAFDDEGEVWPVFSMHALATSPEFLSAAE